MKSIYCCMDWLGRIIVKPSVVLQLTLQACILNHREGGGGKIIKIMCTVILHDVMQYHSTPFPCGRRLLCIFNTLWRVSSMQRLWVNWVSAAIHYYMPLLSGYDHASSLRMSANADLSTTLKCSSSGKKSTEQSIPIDPRQPSVLEPLIVCYFHILLAYHCIVYYGMLNYTACAWSPPD